MKRLTYLLLCLFASIAFATAQTTKVTGTVISAEDDGPIIGASIVVAGTTTGTVTDYNGAFTLDVPSNAKKLIVSYIGMKSVERVQSGVDLREGRDAFHEEDRRRDRPVIGRDQVRDRTL